MHTEQSLLVIQAKSFAEIVHFNQKRNTSVVQRFIVHPAEVVELVTRHGGSETERAAAWLHDTVEDTPVTLELIEFLFGKEVALLVDGLTDPESFAGLPLAERKKLQAERVKDKSEHVKRIKIADQISNVRSVTMYSRVGWDKEKCREYVEGAKLIADQCVVDPFLHAEFMQAYDNFISSCK